MAERQKGMGRGLAAILAVSPREEHEELRELPIDLLSPNPAQPRRRFDEESLLALAESIRVRGVLQPVLVRPLPSGRYELIAGERRWRAARLAERERIPAIVRPQEDGAALEVALIENMVREDLNPVEQARACAALVEELGLSREEVGLRVGRSRVAVSNLLRLLDLPDEALELLERGELTEGHGRALLLTPEHDVRRRLAREAHAREWSVRELESRARGAARADRDGARRRAPRRAAGPAGRLHPDQEAAIAQISETFGPLLGADVEVTPAHERGYRVQLEFGSLAEALEAARRLRPRAL
jgi:ParB family chromosome partitioning protein